MTNKPLPHGQYDSVYGQELVDASHTGEAEPAIAAREQEPRGKRSLAGFMYRHAVDIANRQKHANGWVHGPWQLTFDIEGAKRHPHSGVWPGFEFFPLYRDLSDEVRTDTAIASREEAPTTPSAATPAAPGESAIDDVIQIVRNIYGGVTDGGSDVEAHAYRRAQAHKSILAALSNPAPVAAPAKNCEWTNCVHRVGDVCCNDKEQK